MLRNQAFSSLALTEATNATGALESTQRERIFVMGGRGAGILVVKINPLRVSYVADADIEEYSKSNGVDGYAKAASALARMISDQKAETDPHFVFDGVAEDIKARNTEKYVESKNPVCDLDFAFTSEMNSASLQASKQFYPILKAALCHASKDENDKILFNAILQDTGNIEEFKC